ncbi:MAG: PadR family transcriptional regulator [Acidimicrobiia bacterium]|nr:PadR family transcriptional regulator [Acidimicrobiia bacterium]
MHVGKDLVAASATPMVLAILAEGESYGYAIIKRVNELSGGALEWSDGMLYPLLHRLARLGYVESSWRSAAETGERRRKYYRLTDAGAEALSEQRNQWSMVTETLARVWNETTGNFSPLAGPQPDGAMAR